MHSFFGIFRCSFVVLGQHFFLASCMHKILACKNSMQSRTELDFRDTTYRYFDCMDELRVRLLQGEHWTSPVMDARWRTRSSSTTWRWSNVRSTWLRCTRSASSICNVKNALDSFIFEVRISLVNCQLSRTKRKCNLLCTSDGRREERDLYPRLVLLQLF